MRVINLQLDMSKDYFVGEALRALCTNVQFCGTDVKAIAVTSCYSNEGKSTISLELAKSLAEVGKKVLFIDADLRKSVIVKRYADVTGICGLSQYLSGLNRLEEVLFATQEENLHIIFAGQLPANPVELLNSNAFKKLIQEQTQVYDYVIVDTPPLGMVIDCAVISNVCDSAIMVVATERVSRYRAAMIKSQLLKSGVRILGVVLNRVKNTSFQYHKPYGSSGAYSKKYGILQGKRKKGKAQNDASGMVVATDEDDC